jgi:hypothetical protein
VKRFELNQEIDSIKILFSKSSLFNEDPESLVNWSKFICIIISGFVENTIKVIFNDYVNGTSHGGTNKFAASKISKINNPKFEAVCQLVGSFNPQWREELMLHDLSRDNKLSNSLNAVMIQRHQIAHGKYKSSDITRMRLTDYFSNVVLLLEYLEDKFYL